MLRHDFAAMILDIRMPGMSGIELAHLVKQRQRTQDVPILFLTAHLVDDDDVLRGYGVGAVDYLSKPINADILRSKIAVFVDLYRKTRALAALNEAAAARDRRARAGASRRSQQANQELELRVAERTAALTRCAPGREGKRRAAQDGHGRRANRRVGMGRRDRPDDLVDRSRGAVWLPQWFVR